MSASSILALGWLAVFALAVHLGVPVPDGLGWMVFFVTLWALGFLYFRLCRRFPAFGWIGLGFFAGVFGASRPIYIRNEITVVDDEGNEVAAYDDSCDAAADDSYYDGGGSSASRED
jgi:hypothetical protein